MCRMVTVHTRSGSIKVAGIKSKYVKNIADAAENCDYIDKIVLFGSCTSNRCTSKSDIDLAVFGNVSKGKCLTSKKYERFLKQVFSFDCFSQAYDILYFRSGASYADGILAEIAKGEVLYERTA